MTGGTSAEGARRAACLALVALAALAALVLAPAGARAAGPPNGIYSDPGFAGCESQDSVTGCQDNEQWDKFGPLPGNTCPAPVTETPTLPHPDGGLPCWAPLAHDPQHASGIDETGAFAQGNVGRGDVVVAYIEGGVNYSADDVKDSLSHIYLNKGELPYPELADGKSAGTFDSNHDGVFNIEDYAHDPRVNPSCPSGVAPFSQHVEGTTFGCVSGGRHQYLNAVHVAGKKTPYLSPEDLIAVFGHCKIVNHETSKCPPGGRFDNDGNGYPNDVSGWNFDRNTNDPQTEDASYTHAPGLLSDLVGVPDNGYAGVGVCPNCRVVPIKQGGECLGRTDKWGESILYAADLGARVISSVVVNATYSSFNQRAIDYAYNKGVALSLDSNDFDAMDHTDGMLWNHVLPGNGLAENDTSGQPNTTTWFRSRSNVTSYGTHSVFSGGENSTSGATPFQAGFLAMVQSAALNAHDKGVLPGPLTPNEIKQVLTDTASAIIPQTQTNAPDQWPGNPQSATDGDHTNWSSQYGYGRVDIGAATTMVMQGHIPPTADLTSPRWFQYVDPVSQPRVRVGGSLAPSRLHSGGSATWTLEYAAGADPADSSFITASQGTVTGAKSGQLGTLDLSRIPRSFYEHAPTTTLQPDGAEQYTLTIRLRVRDANGLKAEDRRTIGVRHDPSLVRGGPRYIGAEGGFDATYADLEGRHQLDLVFPTYDGDVHALRPDGSELRGFPVHSTRLRALDPLNPENYRAAAYRQSQFRNLRDPLAGGAVGDLFHTGQLEVVANSTNGALYAWDAHGHMLKGFPRYQPRSSYAFGVPSPRGATPHTRLPDRGSLGPPVLADLEGRHQLDILLTRFDGRVYAYRPNGKAVPGWPVEVKLPAPDFARDGVDPQKYMRDPKLIYGVGVSNVLHRGHPQVFVSSFECNGQSTSTENLGLGLLTPQTSGVAKTWLYGLWADGNRHHGGAYLQNWPVALPAEAFCYDQSIDFVGEGTSPPVFANFGTGRQQIVTSPVTGAAFVVNGDGTIARQLSTACASADCAANPPYRPTGDTHTITLTAQGGLGDLNGSGHPQFIESSTGIESIESALSVNGVASVPQVYEKAWDVSNGSVEGTFPRRQDGFPFYESPLAASLGGRSPRQAIEGNDNYWVHAYDPAGGEAPGFPKYTGQWIGFSGVLADPRMNGQLHYATITREGYLFDWRVAGRSKLNDDWWHYRHDERNTGQFGLDTRRPAEIDDLRARVKGGRIKLTWTAPGNDYVIGTAARYDIRVSRKPITDANFYRARKWQAVPKPRPDGTHQTLTIPRAARVMFIAIRAVDPAGNISALSDVAHVGQVTDPNRRRHRHGGAKRG